MAAETVRIYAEDDAEDALEGVLVRFFDDADAFVTQQYTSIVGADAYAEVTIDGDDPPIEYTIRLSKTGVAFDGSLGDDSKTPQAISIYSPASGSPTGTNYFEVQGQTFTRPVASDSRLCRCSGFFKDHSGRPLVGLDINFIAVCYNEDQSMWTPTIVDGYAVMSDKISVRTDSGGYVQIDLYRTGHYSALIQNLEHARRVLVVPDSSSINLIDLLFPVVSTVTFSPVSVTLDVNDTIDVDVTILASDTQVLDLLDGDITLSSSDTSVATIQTLDDNKLRIFGVSAGTAEITVVRTDSSIASIPEQPATYTPLPVTVS
ncbi:MAG: Ig-like domain-containing protein [Candidatus Hodarchaeales archaeon]|jgi:hypothetical protein